jgi:hypothetical protein
MSTPPSQPVSLSPVLFQDESPRAAVPRPGSVAAPSSESSGAFLKIYNGFGQTPADVAVIIPSTWRSSLAKALRSVIEQEFPGNIQIMLGFDTPNQAQLELDALIGELPGNRSVFAFYPGYSTSQRHGGVQPGFDGGALRILLCYLANASRVAFLDDDNWWTPQHIGLLHQALETGSQLAFTLRWFVDPRDDSVVCVDDWESVGPGRGVYVANFGGFVDPNCLMYDKLACDSATRFWAIPLPSDASRLSTDRQVFNELKNQYSWRAVEQPTVFYRMNLTDPVQVDRLIVMQQRGYKIEPLSR